MPCMHLLAIYALRTVIGILGTTTQGEEEREDEVVKIDSTWLSVLINKGRLIMPITTWSKRNQV